MKPSEDDLRRLRGTIRSGNANGPIREKRLGNEVRASTCGKVCGNHFISVNFGSILAI